MQSKLCNVNVSKLVTNIDNLKLLHYSVLQFMAAASLTQLGFDGIVVGSYCNCISA